MDFTFIKWKVCYIIKEAPGPPGSLRELRISFERKENMSQEQNEESKAIPEIETETEELSEEEIEQVSGGAIGPPNKQLNTKFHKDVLNRGHNSVKINATKLSGGQH